MNVPSVKSNWLLQTVAHDRKNSNDIVGYQREVIMQAILGGIALLA